MGTLERRNVKEKLLWRGGLRLAITFGEAEAEVTGVAIPAAVGADGENPAEQHFLKSSSPGPENPGVLAVGANGWLGVKKYELHFRRGTLLL